MATLGEPAWSGGCRECTANEEKGQNDADEVAHREEQVNSGEEEAAPRAPTGAPKRRGAPRPAVEEIMRVSESAMVARGDGNRQGGGGLTEGGRWSARGVKGG
jgi:hypothetical protein